MNDRERDKPIVIMRLPWWWGPSALGALALLAWNLWAGWTGVISNPIYRPVAVVIGVIGIFFSVLLILGVVATRGRVVVGSAESLTLYRLQPWIGPIVTRLEGDLRDVEMSVHVGRVMEPPERERSRFVWDPQRQLSKTPTLTIEFTGSAGTLWTQIGQVAADYEERFAQWKELVEAHHASD